jgi:ketosteroid isomerase-like protein
MKVSGDVMSAWNMQDVEAVLACYTEDLVYLDPNTHGAINNPQAMRRYLTKLFSGWEMHWSVRSAHPLKDESGETVRWHATFKRPGRKEIAEVDGMDLVIYEGDRIKRNEVYFDRTLLMPLMSK